MQENKKLVLNNLEEIMEDERFSEIGRLMGGVAHDLNNPLMVIMGLSELLTEEMSANQELQKQMQTIYDNSKKCRHIIHNLMLFCRQATNSREAVDIHEIIEEVLELTAYEIKKKFITVKKDYEQGVSSIIIDPEQVRQAFLNIMLKAIYFMSKKEGECVLEIQTKKSDGCLIVSFKDNGTNVPAEEISHMFDPFFAHKDIPVALRLGLSACYNIVKEHQGDIHLENTEGGGSVMTVTFKTGIPKG